MGKKEKDPETERLSKRVLAWMNDNHYTQQSLAARLKCSTGQLRRVNRGLRPGRNFLRKLYELVETRSDSQEMLVMLAWWREFGHIISNPGVMDALRKLATANAPPAAPTIEAFVGEQSTESLSGGLSSDHLTSKSAQP